MVIPKFLEPHKSAIYLVATARNISKDELNRYVKFFSNKGYMVIYSDYLISPDSSLYLAGSDKDRQNALQKALNKPDVDAIWAVRGGYGTSRILDGLRFDEFLEYPKWVIGYSDLTALLSAVVGQGVAALHAASPINIDMHEVNTENLERAVSFLEGKSIVPNLENLSPYNRPGKAQARLIGGNLSLLAHSIATPTEYSYDDCILFIEDLDEYLYHIDRMMLQLQRSGRLNNIKGLVVGGFTHLKDNNIPFGKNYQEIILEKLDALKLKIPVLFDYPAGHGYENYPLVMGGMYELIVYSLSAQLTWQK